MSNKIDPLLGNKLNQLKKQIKSNKFELENLLFDKQLEFVTDPSRFKVCTCSRRAGKSFSLIVYMLWFGLNNPYTTILYVMSTKTRAVKVAWRELNRFNEEYNLDLKFDNAKHEIKFPNGTLLMLSGIKDMGEVDGLRGISPSPSLIIVDEAGHTTPHLPTFITEVATPALMDELGTLIMIGTPNPHCSGAFYDAFHQREGYRKFKPFFWTFYDNPMIPSIRKGKATHEDIMKEILDDTGLSIDHPSIAREYRGLWIKDLEALLYYYDETINNMVDPLQGEGWQFVGAVDTGFRDNCGFAVVAYHEEDEVAYILEAYDRDYKDVTRIIEEMKAISDRYPGIQMIYDPGAGGGNMAAELQLRYGIVAGAAQKTDKNKFIALMNADLRRGLVKINAPECSDLITGWNNVTKYYKDNGTLVINSKLNGIKIDHCLDAALYAWRYALHYNAKPPKKEYKVGSEEYFIEMERQHYNKVLEETNRMIRKENRKFKNKIYRRF